MNNYILSKDSTLIYNDITYTYSKTNNEYPFPYVFNNDSARHKTIYINALPDQIGSTSVMASYSSDGKQPFHILVSSLNYSIVAYSLATIEEATIIGETVLEQSNLIISKNNLSTYNCKLTDTPSIEYNKNNQCVNYIDIIENEIPIETGTIIRCFIWLPNVMSSGYIGGTSSNYVESLRTYTLLYDTATHQFIDDPTTYQKVYRGFFAVKFKNSTLAPTQTVTKFAIDKFGSHVSKKSDYALPITKYYEISSSGIVGGNIIDQTGQPTGQIVEGKYLFPDFNIDIDNADEIISKCQQTGEFTGHGTMDHPYNVYFNMEIISVES